MSTRKVAAHTPGPWEVDPPLNWVGHRWKCSVRGGQSGSSIAEVYLGGETGLSCDADLVQANARLIAAAPELLEALEAIVAEADQSNGGKGARLPIVVHIKELAESAIAEARAERGAGGEVENG